MAETVMEVKGIADVDPEAIIFTPPWIVGGRYDP
jgi:hypothetical protein